MGLRKISKFFKKFFFRFPPPPQRGKDPPTRILRDCMSKALVLTRKIPFRTSFYFNLTLTNDVLNVMFGRVRHVKSWCFESLSHVKAIEMQAVLLKTSFVVVFQCRNNLWCHLNILFFDILTILLYLFQFLLSYNSKQLSTFHLPFGGDENVLAKNLVLLRRNDCKSCFYCCSTSIFKLTFLKLLINLKYITWTYY